MPETQLSAQRTVQHHDTRTLQQRQQSAPADDLPTIALITTGGTITGSAASAGDTTGYTAAALPLKALVDKLPDIDSIARLHIASPFDIDSKDITLAHWRALADHVDAALSTSEIDGVVITHGTDTLEESAFILDWLLNSPKPVVMTGAMRPATALSSDGLMNLYDAICTAAHPDSSNRGVIVCFNRSLFAGHHVRKHRTDSLDAFRGPPQEEIGLASPVRYFAPPFSRRPLRSPAPLECLPRVDILYVAADMAADLLTLAISAGARGIVLALPGNGSLPTAWEETVRDAVSRGIPVIRASRCATGTVSPHPLDQRLGTRPAGDLSPAAARLCLALQLAEAAQRQRGDD